MRLFRPQTHPRNGQKSQIWAKRYKNLGCDYLILDCLRPVLDSLGLSEDKETGQFLGAFDALLYEAGIPDALLVHHMGHTNERSRGDSRLVDWPESTLKLIRDGDEATSPRYFSVLGRDAAVAEGRLSFDPKTRHLTYSAGSRADIQTEAALLAVIKLLAEDFVNNGTGLSGVDIERGVAPIPRDVARKALKKECEKGSGAQISWRSGPKGAHLHSLTKPCAVCGMPVSWGGTSHLSCKTGAGP